MAGGGPACFGRGMGSARTRMTGRLALGALLGAALLACAGQVALSVVSVDGDAAVEAGAEAAPEPAPREDGGGGPAWHPLVGEVVPTFPVVDLPNLSPWNAGRPELAFQSDGKLLVLWKPYLFRIR